jgi:sulfotransferase
MDKRVFFLSGLPRSGSTLLGSLLGQNPDFTVTPTSPILDLLCATNGALDMVNKTYTFDYKTKSENIYKAMIEGFYADIKTKYIIDKHRGYPKNIVPLRMFFEPNPKIICTNRPVADVLTSYISLIEKNNDPVNFVDEELRKQGLAVNSANRAKILWEGFVSDPYNSMVHGIKNARNNLYIVEYDSLVNDPKRILKEIYEFLELEPFNKHQFNNIHNYCAEEKDQAWGLRNLHDIRKNLGKTSKPAKEVLGAFLESHYNQFNLKY